jgi:hypothetical protein
MKKSELRQIIREEIENLRENNLKKLIKGAEITIEMDDQDGDFNAGDYKIVGLYRGGIIVDGMGKRNFKISLGALKDTGFTINN